MRETGPVGTWKTNDYNDPGAHPTATGPGKWAWFIGDSEGDPEAYVANSTPTLKANFSLAKGVKTLQVMATGGGLSFEEPSGFGRGSRQREYRPRRAEERGQRH